MKPPRGTTTLVVLTFLAALFAVPNAAAVTAIIQVTPSVAPAALTPGGSGSISLVLKNTGDASTFRMETQVVEADPEIILNRTMPIGLGGLGADESTTVVPLTFTVARDAAPGVYIVDLRLWFSYLDGGATEYNEFTYSVTVTVRSAANLLVKSVDPPRLEPGKDVAATITLQNPGAGDFLNVIGVWSSAKDALLPLGGSNRFQVGVVPAFGTAQVPVRIAANAGAAPGLYALTFTLAYTDVAGNAYLSNTTVGMSLISRGAQQLSVSVQNVTREEITIAVTNVGTSPVSGVQLRLVDPKGFSFEEGDSIALGTIAAGAFKTAKFEVDRDGDASAATAYVEYTDSLGARASQSEPLSFGTEKPAAQTSGVIIGVVTAGAILGIEALIAIGIVLRRRTVRRQSAKAEKEEAIFADLARQDQGPDEIRR